MGKALIALVLSVSIIFMVGCSKTQRTYKTNNGTVTVTTKNTPGPNKGTVEIKTKDGTASMTTEAGKAVTESELGVPVYPGATAENTAKYEGQNGSGMQSIQQFILTTPDSFEKVEAFYKTNLKNVQSNFSQNQGDTKTAVFVTGTEKASVSVTIGSEKDQKQTTIHVMKTNQ